MCAPECGPIQLEENTKSELFVYHCNKGVSVKQDIYV